MLKTILPVLSLADNCHLKNQTCSMVMLIVPICYNHNTKCTTDCFFFPKFWYCIWIKDGDQEQACVWLELKETSIGWSMYPSLPQGYKCLFHCRPLPSCLVIPPGAGTFPNVLGLGLAMPCPGPLYPHPHPRPLPYTKRRIQSTQIGSNHILHLVGINPWLASITPSTVLLGLLILLYKC